MAKAAMIDTGLVHRRSIRCEPRVGSKKHALEILSELLADAAEGPAAADVLTGLVQRERLGSTALGDRVAMPHTRHAGLSSQVGAVLQLDEPVDFGAPDGRPVELLFGLLVPDGTAADEVSHTLERVRRLCHPEIQARLRPCEPQRLYDVIEATVGADTDPCPGG